MNILFVCLLTLLFTVSNLGAAPGAGDDPLAGIENLLAGTADWQRVELAPGEMREFQLETEVERDGRWGTP